MTPFESWREVLAVGLIHQRPPRAHLAALAQFMVPPIADPLTATYEVRPILCSARTGTNRWAYFCNGRQMRHLDLLRKKFSVYEPGNSYAWLQKYRGIVDERILALGDSVPAKVLDIWMDLERCYADPNFPAKPVYEAFCLGRVLEALDADRCEQTR